MDMEFVCSMNYAPLAEAVLEFFSAFILRIKLLLVLITIFPLNVFALFK